MLAEPLQDARPGARQTAGQKDGLYHLHGLLSLPEIIVDHLGPGPGRVLHHSDSVDIERGQHRIITAEAGHLLGGDGFYHVFCSLQHGKFLGRGAFQGPFPRRLPVRFGITSKPSNDVVGQWRRRLCGRPLAEDQAKNAELGKFHGRFFL